MGTITLNGVTFKHCQEWTLKLKKYDIITPIWKRGKCVMLLITRRESGKAFYVNANTMKLAVYAKIKVINLPQGITYELLENITLSVLSTMIGFYPDDNKVIKK